MGAVRTPCSSFLSPRVAGTHPGRPPRRRLPAPLDIAPIPSYTKAMPKAPGDRPNRLLQRLGILTLGAGPGTDLHLIRPSDVQTNSRRSNKWFDSGGAEVPNATARADQDSWEPPADERGDIARALAYGAITYDERPDLRLIPGEPNDARDGTFGDLDTLRTWHHADPVDDRERERNAAVQQLQGNANPFVNDPGLFDRIWPPEGR